MSLSLVDVMVVKATDIVGMSSSKKFCVYLRLQGQGVRTNTNKLINGEVAFNEKFRMRYNPQAKSNQTRNELFIELWTKGILQNNCVSISWVYLNAFNLIQGIPLTLNVNGSFEGSSAKVLISILPVNFSYKGSLTNRVSKNSSIRQSGSRLNKRDASLLFTRPDQEEFRPPTHESNETPSMTPEQWAAVQRAEEELLAVQQRLRQTTTTTTTSAGTSTTATLINAGQGARMPTASAGINAGTTTNSALATNNNTTEAQPVQGIPIYCNHTPYSTANYTGPGELTYLPSNPLPPNIDPVQLMENVDEDSSEVRAIAGPFPPNNPNHNNIQNNQAVAENVVNNNNNNNHHHANNNNINECSAAPLPPLNEYFISHTMNRPSCPPEEQLSYKR